MEENITLDPRFSGESVEIRRSEIRPADYNPREITKEGRAALKRSIRKFGVVGGIVVNSQTGNTIVGGHQKVSVLDEMNGFDPATGENDYLLRVELIDVDEKTEKSLNVALNNPNVGGQWDFDKLREIVPDIDVKSSGLTDADLNMIGIDVTLRTGEMSDMARELDMLADPLRERREVEKAARIEAEDAEYDPEAEAEDDGLEEMPSAALRANAAQPKTYEEKRQHMKDVKREVREQAQEKAENMAAYVVISFDTYRGKAEFCERFGYPSDMQFIKGEVFSEQVERVE